MRIISSVLFCILVRYFVVVYIDEDELEMVQQSTVSRAWRSLQVHLCHPSSCWGLSGNLKTNKLMTPKQFLCTRMLHVI